MILQLVTLLEFLKKQHAHILKKIKTPFQKKLLNIFIFLALFAALSLPLHFLLWINFNATPVQIVVANTVGWMLDASGIAVSQNGLFLSAATKTGPLTVKIIKDCVGWKSMLALFGLIFATPKIEMKKRIAGLAAGVPVIFLGNLLRIYATMYVTVYGGLEYWEVTHTYLWQEGLIFLVIATWYVWLRICNSRSNKLSFI